MMSRVSNDTQFVAGILLDLKQLILEREACRILTDMRECGQTCVRSSSVVFKVLPCGELFVCDGM